MKFSRKYQGKTQVSSDAISSEMSFAPDALREPTFFVGILNKHVPFREAMSALHHVVVSDLRFQPKDRVDYKAWLEAQESLFLAEAMSQKSEKEQTLRELKEELKDIQANERKTLAPYYKAQSKYFNYLYKNDYNAWFVLDPVITVHPDKLFFECFSQDESSYGKLSCDYEIFSHITDHAYGTTNIDYSHELYQEFQKIRDYKETQFKVDPSGFEVKTELSDDFKEEKIDLPESWVRGFLQVSSAMSLPFIQFYLHPMDVYNLLLILKRHKERASPRSIRFILIPNQPVKMLFEPWGFELVCQRSIYQGEQQEEVRIWGRRRLFILERLLPIVKRFKVSLLGTGLPSFWVAEMTGMSFTLGLSGWSANDFSRMGHFDLMAPRADVDSVTAENVFNALSETWVESAASLSIRLGLDELTIKAALGIYAQYGRVLYDMDQNLYRIRELSQEPLPMDQLRFSHPREEKAAHFIKANLVTIISKVTLQGKTVMKGEVMDDGKVFQPEMTIDSDMRLIEARCHCHFYHQHKINQGPCEHMLAVRLSG